MPNSWDPYFILFLSAVVSLGIPASLFLFSLFLSPRKKASSLPKGEDQPLNRTILGQRINVRFFLAVNAALILMTLAIELIPCVTTLHQTKSGSSFQGLLSVVSLAGFSVLGLLYSVKKGDMGWLSSYQTKKPDL